MRKMGARNTVLEKPDAIPSEHVEQRNFVRWFRQTHPTARIAAIPNGGSRSMAAAAKLKAEGVSPGIPDLFIPAWGLWVEMKRVKGGKISADQKLWADYLESVGYCVIVSKGCDDAIKQVTDYWRQHIDNKNA